MTPDELKTLSHEMNTQDNLATSHPLYCVFDKDYIWGMDPNFSDQYKWLDVEGVEVDLEQYELSEDLVEDEEGFAAWQKDVGIDLHINKVYYAVRDRFLNAHFTMKAAHLYIDQNRHNLNKPFVYVVSLYRCHEMIKIQDHLKSFTKSLPHPTKNGFVVENKQGKSGG